MTPWTTAHQGSRSITNSWSSFKTMSIESVMPSNHLILCRSLLLLPSTQVHLDQFSSVQLLSHVWLFATPWTAARQASLFTTNSRSLLKLMSIRKDSSYFYVQFSSVVQLCPTLCDPMDCSLPDFPVHHQLLELAQTHVQQVSDAIQSHLMLSPSLPAFYLSQHQGLCQWVSSSH